MTIFKCKMCGGSIEVKEGSSVGICDSCGTQQTLPRLDDERRANLYDRANHFRRNNEFDKATGIYEQILNEDKSDAEAYWSLVLCRYGIEYVEDPATHKRVPTVNRTQFTSIFNDDNYKSALRYADGYQRAIYEKEANAINEIQKGILAISRKEEPFDVFICYKETDNNGRRTPDSVLANDLYHQLTQEGFKVFFSRITLEDKLGTAYEPYIFAALNSAKVMVVLGTKPEFFNAVWVKNEWSRYLNLVKQSGGKKILIPAYKDMDPYDLPEEFSHLQAQDMSKLGFMQDLIRGIKKIVRTNEPQQTVREDGTVNAVGLDTKPLLKRAFLFLEDGDWESANMYCEKVLDRDPENAWAYLGKMLAELHIHRREDLVKYKQDLSDNINYQKIIRFGSDKLKDYITRIDERNKNDRLMGIYKKAVDAMNTAKGEIAYAAAAKIFKTISGFKDADSLAERCLDKAENCRKDAIYDTAKSLMSHESITGYEKASQSFHTISGWRDADEQKSICLQKIKEIRVREEQQRIAAEKREQQRIAEAKEQRRILLAKLRIALLVMCIIIVTITVCAIVSPIVIRKHKQNKAQALIDSGNYSAAYTLLEEIGDNEAITLNKKDRVHALLDSGDYSAAYSLLEEIGDNEAITSSVRDRAMKILDSGDYNVAYSLLEKIGDNEAIMSNKSDRAMRMLDSGNYKEAFKLFAELGSYGSIVAEKNKKVLALIDSGDYESAYILLYGIDYEGSVDQQRSIDFQHNKILISTAEVGSCVSFGSYEQDNNESNGKEDIEWLVLEKKDDQILLVSKYALDCQPFDNLLDYSNDNSIFGPSVYWEDCSLRKWLNNTFINDAFSLEEQNCIINTKVEASSNSKFKTFAGVSTVDKIFLFSIWEVKKYFESNEAKKCRATDFAIARGAFNKEGFCWWWLRTPGRTNSFAAAVDEVGSGVGYGINTVGFSVDDDRVAVRPAMWINIEP